jgi:hypothetical protein
MVCNYNQHFELNNILDDIGEHNNLAQKYPQKVDELSGKSGKYLRNSDAQRPICKVNGQLVPCPDEVKL